MIKINIDVAFTPSKAALAVVALNHQGEVIKAWRKLCHLGSLLIAEVAAIQWTAQLAVFESWSHVILEGGFKICFNSIAGKYQSVDWSISAMTDNIRSLVVSFAACSFSWINRSCNGVAHAAAKLALVSSSPFCCNNGNLPIAL
nr:hypothetical protein CFP56_59002 [Quercus suber]